MPYVHVGWSEKDAKMIMSHWISDHFSEIKKVYKSESKIICKNGNIHLFMAYFPYLKWCTGRTYILMASDSEGVKYHSDNPVESEDK